ncbi:MAG TPA: uroporphyrinogen-III synthase [Gammaproteobacteria bacterium]|nr:uroporphyrinogen-III synthase [Gammaproteobacteria bacterium]
MSNIWVTRPEPYGQALIRFLKEKGYQQVSYFPCLEIIPWPLMGWPKSDWLVITSQQTVNILHQQIMGYQGPIFTVGPRTAQALKKLKLDVFYPQKNYTSKAMLDELFEEGFPKGVGLVLDGVPRETKLLSRLLAKGLDFEVRSCYQRKAVHWNHQHELCYQQGRPDYVVLTSYQSLQSYINLVKSKPSLDFKLIKTIVVNEQMLGLACQEGIEVVSLAEGPEAVNLLKELKYDQR